MERYLRGSLDLLTVLAITRFGNRPAHLFGGLGLAFGIVGVGVLLYLTFHWLLFPDAIGTRPLLSLGVLLTLLSAQFIFFGILAEIVLRRSRTTSMRDLVAEALISQPRPSDKGVQA
jgi:dolichol-phosphate mannosyltransferase